MGNQTIYFKREPRIIATSTIAGSKECEGIIGAFRRHVRREHL